MSDRFNKNTARSPPIIGRSKKQRVAIVRALLMHPKLSFDEVTAASDPEMRLAFLQLINHPAQEGQNFMILATHEMQFAQATDLIIFLIKKTAKKERLSPSLTTINQTSTGIFKRFFDFTNLALFIKEIL